MTTLFKKSAVRKPALCGSALALILGLLTSQAVADGSKNTSFTRALAEAAASDETLAAFYRENGYDDLWTGPDDAARRVVDARVLAAERHVRLAAQREAAVPDIDAAVDLKFDGSVATGCKRTGIGPRISRPRPGAG